MVAVVALLLGCRGERDSQDEAALRAEGMRIYREQFCGACHAFAAAGTGGTFGPPHDGMREVAEQRLRDPRYRGSAKSAEDYVRESIRDADAWLVPGYEQALSPMPSYTELSAFELNALVRLLLGDSPAGGR